MHEDGEGDADETYSRLSRPALHLAYAEVGPGDLDVVAPVIGKVGPDGARSQGGEHKGQRARERVVAGVARFVASNSTVKPHKTIFRIRYGGTALPHAVVRLLYTDATIYLNRKYARARQLLDSL